MKASKNYLDKACVELEKLEVALQAAENFVYDREDTAKLEQSERYHVIKRRVSDIIEMLECTLAYEDMNHYLPF